MRIDRQVIQRGAIAGFLAGLTLIVLFFVYDLLARTPLATPQFLASAVLGDAIPDPSPLRMALYTIAHLGVFTVLGVGAAMFFTAFEVPRNLTIGAAYGLFACSLVFYPALVVTGTDILAAPAWPAVFFGNVVAGLVMVGYLHWASDEEGVTGLWSLLRANPVVRQGIVAGLIGAVVVAVWFLVVDSIAGRPMFTPAALGSAIFHGAGGPPGVDISANTVVGYTFIHVAAFLLAGVLVSALVTQAERAPYLIFGMILLLVIFETFFIAMVAMLGTWLMEALAWWSVLVGNLLAAASMGGYLLKVHPKLRAKLREDKLWAEP
ncbi:MAG TPA: hypothetical protein VLA33_01125 [Gemmatimonadota bacterium]|nr:hypothetical protein [Gemmatimonadota bacterium]